MKGCTLGCSTRVLLLKLGQKSFAPITFHPILAAGSNAQSNPRRLSTKRYIRCDLPTREYAHPFFRGSLTFRKSIGKKGTELTLARCHSAARAR